MGCVALLVIHQCRLEFFVGSPHGILTNSVGITCIRNSHEFDSFPVNSYNISRYVSLSSFGCKGPLYRFYICLVGVRIRLGSPKARGPVLSIFVKFLRNTIKTNKQINSMPLYELSRARTSSNNPSKIKQNRKPA